MTRPPVPAWYDTSFTRELARKRRQDRAIAILDAVTRAAALILLALAVLHLGRLALGAALALPELTDPTIPRW